MPHPGDWPAICDPSGVMNDDVRRREAMMNKPFVLVCDDNDAIGKSIAFILKTAGYRAEAVRSALDCVAVARQTPPDLIVMDLMMPGMDGATATELMRDVPRISEVPFVFISAMPEEQVKERALDAGAADYVLKPFRKDLLLGVIQRCIPVAMTPELTA
jgi:CheY-like chemotaxis protein